jgi:hypothetical protein
MLNSGAAFMGTVEEMLTIVNGLPADIPIIQKVNTTYPMFTKTWRLDRSC